MKKIIVGLHLVSAIVLIIATAGLVFNKCDVLDGQGCPSGKFYLNTAFVSGLALIVLLPGTYWAVRK